MNDHSIKLPVPRPGILDIAAYVGGESHLAGVERVIKLASNEGALGPSPRAVEALRAYAPTLHRYPDGSVARLREALGARWGLEADRIVCGAGSDELITLLIRAYAGPGDEVLQSRHGFLMYGIGAKSVGASVVMAPERDLTADMDALLDAVTPRTRLVFLANPNNPTGTCVPAREIRRLHQGLPGDVVLVLDAAYAEFVLDADYDAGAALVRDSGNVVMLRTFSKLYALAGLRLGWGYCPPAIADVLNRLRGPFNVSAAAEAAALAALGDDEFLERSRAHNAYWLAWLSEALAGLGIETVPSHCNFLLARFGDAAKADAADAALRAAGIIVRKMGAYGLPDSLRITIGTEPELRALVEALGAFTGQA
jgi:histidinol-phosphate aminotransferase